MVNDFGNGIYLDEDLDFEVDNGGDLRTSRDLEELYKDLSLFLAVELQEVLGERIDRKTLKRAELLSERVVLDDPRINSVSGVIAEESETNPNGIDIQIEGEANDEVFDFVIEVGVQ